MRFIVVTLFTAALVCGVAAQYGDVQNGFPGWNERAVIVLTNACRAAPVSYRDAYLGNSTILAKYPARNPLYWHYDLNRSARAHAVDMATNCGMQHPSCDGTAWNTRIGSYYTGSGNMGENIACSSTKPQDVVKMWLLDTKNGVVPADSTGLNGDGHRGNIMSAAYRVIGTGYATGPMSCTGTVGTKNTTEWVQDFAGGKPATSNLIASACHLFLVSGKTTFMANYCDTTGGAPKSAQVVVDGQTTALTLEMGTASRGVYSVALAAGTLCRPYYFLFVDAKGTQWRYPENGLLVTFGEGTCAEDYRASTVVGLPNSTSRGSVAARRNAKVVAGEGVRVLFSGAAGRAVVSDAQGRRITPRAAKLP